MGTKGWGTDLIYTNFKDAIRKANKDLLSMGLGVNTITWQGKSSDKFSTLELLNYSFSCEIPHTVEELQEQINPNLPWAENHFLERVSGEPLNPGREYKNWPFYREDRGMREFTSGAEPLFSHTYMERIWCPARPGIRYGWGNLDDVIELLRLDPHTRQAYLPIFFPEDAGAGLRVRRRTPCTIGYHFMLRGDKLHIFYTIRSCDALRHFIDDLYLTARLDMWVLDQLRYRDGASWANIIPGNLSVQIFSFHIFQDDIPILEYKLSLDEKKARKR